MDPIAINVSQLRAAVVDEEWRKQFLANENPSTRSVPPPGAGTVHGIKFHQCAREFADELVSNGHSISMPVDELRALLHRGEAKTFVEGLLEKGRVDEASHFLDALKRFAMRVGHCRDRSEGVQSWAELLVAREYSLRDVQFKTDKRIIFVSGIIDGLRRHPDGELEIVDYKLTRGKELKKDLIQIALYDWLLRSQEEAIATRGCLEYFQPDLHVVEATAAELKKLFDEVVQPVLMEIADKYVASEPSPPSSVSLKSPSPTNRTQVQSDTKPTKIEDTKPNKIEDTKPNKIEDTKPNKIEPAVVSGGEPALTVGGTRDRFVKDVGLSFSALVRHTAVLGGSGSGKTTLALNLLEQVLMAGIPVVLVDRKGDLCRYADPELRSDPKLRAFFEKVQVQLFTPGGPIGRPLGIGIVPERMSDLDKGERDHAFRVAAQGLGAMMGLKSSARDQARIAVLVRSLQAYERRGGSGGTDSLQMLIDMMSNPDEELLNSLGVIEPSHLVKLAEQLQTLSIMKGELFQSDKERLSAELLLGLDEAGGASTKAQLSIISTKFLGDEQTALFWVAQLLIELQRFASRSPQPHLQAVVMFDEADLYLPAVGKPVTKNPMENLLKRARSAGIGIILASQSPGDLDYKSRENIRTWFMGLIKQKTALEKLRPVLAESKLDGEAMLPKQKVGQFFMVSEKGATAIQSKRSLVETEQMSEAEILELARQQKTDS